MDTAAGHSLPAHWRWLCVWFQPIEELPKQQTYALAYIVSCGMSLHMIHMSLYQPAAELSDGPHQLRNSDTLLGLLTMEHIRDIACVRKYVSHMPRPQKCPV